MTLTVGSLFSGIGGFDLGFERAGFAIKWQVEADPFCLDVLASHWPSVSRYLDVCDAHGCVESACNWGCDSCLAEVDVICGGFPCQDVSVANADGDGLDGARSGLWLEFHRIVGELRPRYVVVENVANLANRGLPRLIGDLARIGYDAEWTVISAAEVGAPHLRKRLWVVAYPQREGLPRRDQGPRVFGTAPPAFTESSNAPFGSWRDVDAAIGGIPHLHGVSVQLVRDRVHAYGNALVPQIAEWIARRIKEAMTDDAVDPVVANNH